MTANTKLWYITRDCGDGSVSSDFYATEAEAKNAEQDEEDEGGQMFGESTVNSVKLRWNGRNIQFMRYNFDKHGAPEEWHDLPS